jgi:hypothetical protein
MNRAKPESVPAIFLEPGGGGEPRLIAVPNPDPPVTRQMLTGPTVDDVARRDRVDALSESERLAKLEVTRGAGGGGARREGAVPRDRRNRAASEPTKTGAHRC